MVFHNAVLIRCQTVFPDQSYAQHRKLLREELWKKYITTVYNTGKNSKHRYYLDVEREILSSNWQHWSKLRAR
jgi:hypothetical protein